MGYLKTTVYGVGWIGGLRIFTRVLAYIKLAVLARMLLPSQFGVFGVASLALAFLEVFTQTGVNIFLIQTKKDIGKYINTAWTISIVRGIFITVLILIFAKPLSDFFNSPASYNILILISIVPLLRGLINPSVVTMKKDLQFRKEFAINGSVFMFDTIVAVSLALITRSEMSLVFGLIAGVIAENVLTHALFRPRPRLIFRKNVAKEIVSKGKWITGDRIFQYIFRQGDDIVVGKLMGEKSLGLYQVGYKISTLPVTEISDVVHRVTFPIYSKISSEKQRVQKAFYKTLSVILILSFLLGSVVYLFPEEIIVVILGENWLEISNLLRVLIIFGFIKSVANSTDALFFAMEKQKYVSATSFVSTGILILIIIPMVSSFGLMGAAYSAIVGVLASVPVRIYLVKKVFA